MKGKILSLGILLTSLLPLATMAGGISVTEAMDIAKAFMKQQGLKFTPDSRKGATKADTENGYYVFNGNRGTGFVIVCADDRAVKPVLAYSDNGSFDYDLLPPNAREWMDEYTREIRMLGEDNDKQSSLKPETVTGFFDYGTAVAPLLTTAWGQGDPYNQLCPLVGNEYTLTGCGATALAQIMYYHQWPAKGRGSITYTWKSTKKRLSRPFRSSTYEWSEMTPTYDEGSTTAAQQAVAQLMRDCGYAQKMDYGLAYSSSYPKDIPNALTNFFNYDKKTVRLVERDTYDGNWEDLLRSELDNRRPVFYVGYGTGGHAFVCDGCDQAGYFHFNFGWNGEANAYFAITAIRPDRSDYSYGHFAVVGIQKPGIAVTGVRLDKSTLTIKDNETARLTATVLPETATDKSVTWSSSNEAVATVDENGLVTPGSSLGTTIITCTSVSTPAKKATCRLTVKTSKVAVTKVRLNKSATCLKADVTEQLMVTILPENATDKSVTWSSSDEKVATVDDNGLVTTHSAGKATITCQSIWTPTKKATCRITVMKAVTRGDSEDGKQPTEPVARERQSNDVYDLHGRKVLRGTSTLDGLPKGIYIINGRKVVK